MACLCGRTLKPVMGMRLVQPLPRCRTRSNMYCDGDVRSYGHRSHQKKSGFKIKVARIHLELHFFSQCIFMLLLHSPLYALNQRKFGFIVFICLFPLISFPFQRLPIRPANLRSDAARKLLLCSCVCTNVCSRRK